MGKIFWYIIIIFILLMVNHNYLQEKFNPNLYLSSPTKCFSCEKQMRKMYGPQYSWIGKPTKSFDSQRDMVNWWGPNYGNLGLGTKCFSCEHPGIQNLLIGV